MDKDFYEKIWELDTFQSEYRECIRHFCQSQYTRSEVRFENDHALNWKYLIEASTVLLNSNNGIILDAVVRIASAAINSSECTNAQKSIAAWIFQKLRNELTVSMAIRKSVIPEGYSKFRPAILNLGAIAEKIDSTLTFNGDNHATLNDFQLRLWNALESGSRVSASAATAAGKSYVLMLWICERFRKQKLKQLIYIAPTRALVSEIEQSLQNLCSEFSLNLSVSSVPWELGDKDDFNHVYVLTQERYHLLLNRSEVSVNPDVLVVDEAHKIDEEVRGVIMEAVVEQTTNAFPRCQIAFISPSVRNPEILTAGLGINIRSEIPTVNQNLLWVSQVPRKRDLWELDHVSNAGPIKIGDIHLPLKPDSSLKKLAYIAGTIGENSAGNIVYTTTASYAEKIAILLSQIIPENTNGETIKALDDLDELVAYSVHDRFQLRSVIKKGVAFHYGNMPEILRREIESLFSAGHISYLICTSTLIEGVNLSCRNIFLRGASKGTGKRMRPEDFWNLAGRAGRWGKEFAGNVYCIDPTDEKIWYGGKAPRSKEGIEVVRSTSRFLDVMPGKISELGKDPKQIEIESAALSLILRSKVDNKDLKDANFLAGLSVSTEQLDCLTRLAEEVYESFGGNQNLLELVRTNPHINPLGILKLYYFFKSHSKHLNVFKPVDPSDDDAINIYAVIFKYCYEYLGADKIGLNEKLSLKNSIIVCRWMCGWKIPRIIEATLKYWKKRDANRGVNTIIREVLNDIENIARFHAPNALSCYVDVLNIVLKEHGDTSSIDEMSRFSVMLEYGVASQTQLSLISIGLSRNTAIELYEIIAGDDLTPDQVKERLKELDVDKLDVPELIRLEIKKALDV